MEIETPPLPLPSLNGHSLNGHQPVLSNGNDPLTEFSPPVAQTGPRTLAGKTQMRSNALKHGLSATDDVFVENLDEKQSAAYHKIRRALYNFYTPVSSLERLLVDRMAVQHVRTLTLYRLETVAIRFLPMNKGSDVSVLPHLDRFARYDSRLDRNLRVLHNRFRIVRNMRLDQRSYSIPVKE